MNGPRQAAWRPILLAVLLAVLGGCASAPAPAPAPDPGRGPGTVAGTLDSAWALQERGADSPPGYGLYTVLLVRAPSRNAVRTLTEVFVTTVGAADAELAPQNLNLIAIPVRNGAAAAAATAAARQAPMPTAATLLERHYDYGAAARLIASVCRPERGQAVMRACGSDTVEGPLLVTSTRPIDPASALSTQRLLVVNLSTTSPAAIGEVMAAYRRQIRRADFADRAETDHWRLAVLDVLLDAAGLLPGIGKAMAGTVVPSP